jgi:hypothetical protein
MGAEASLGAIVRAKGGAFLAAHATSPDQRKVLRAIADCRTEAMGGHRDRCDHCGGEHTFWNSCRNRHCPGCGAEARQQWLAARARELLEVPYFHVVFTIPECLHPLARSAPAIVYAILLRAAGQAILQVAATKLKARVAALAILHTWTQRLTFHPHVHGVVPGGGVSFDGRRWVSVPDRMFLVAVQVLSRRFRTLVSNALRQAFDDGSLALPATIAPDRTALDLLLARSWKTDWHAYVKPPFGGARHVLAYLAGYTHRMAISNARILAFDGERVTFAYRDRKHGDTRKTITLDAVTFLGRFVQHIVPARFVRIRYCGFLANRNRAKQLTQARRLIAEAQQQALHGSGTATGAAAEAATDSESVSLPLVTPTPARRCPQCGIGSLVLIARVLPGRARTWFDTS